LQRLLDVPQAAVTMDLGLDLLRNKVPLGANLVDVLHLLLANAERGERLDHLVERYRGQREPIRAGLEYLKQKDPNRWSKACDKLLPFYSDLFAQTAAAAKEGK